MIHAPGWQPVVLYPVAEADPEKPVSLETVRGTRASSTRGSRHLPVLR
ncbi:hypothetical protein ACFQ0B_48030 [Nonomuraea thailandensis]